MNFFENQKTFVTIDNKSTNQMLGFPNGKPSENKLIDQNNRNAYQPKSDSKIREKIRINDKFDKKKNSINKLLDEINNIENNEFQQSNNESIKDSNINDSKLKDINTKNNIKNMILSKSNNVYINYDSTEQMLCLNKDLNNNNCYNNDNINGNFEDIHTNDVLKFKKSNSVNINNTNTVETDLEGKTKQILYLMRQNNINNNNQNSSNNQQNNQFFNNDKNLYIYSNNDNNGETNIMLNKNEMINNQYNQNQNMNNMKNMNLQNSLFNNNNNFNNGMIYGNFKVYANNS